MPTETLNLEYHKKRLLLKALNKYTTRQAAKKLGITERNLFQLKVQYNIVRKQVYVIEGEFELKHNIKTDETTTSISSLPGKPG